MTSPDYYVPSSSDDYSYNASPVVLQQHSLTSRIMISAIIVLFCVIFFLTSLHIFGKWLCRSRNRDLNRIHLMNQQQATSANAGLGKDTIAQLPIFTYTTPATSDPSSAGKDASLLECAVCLMEFQANEKGRLLPSCKHRFHIECIDMWLYSHSTCPLCRTMVMPTITTSPLMSITVTTHEQQQGEEEEALNTIIQTPPSAQDHNPLSPTAIPHGGDLAHAVQIPSNVLFFRNPTQMSPSHSAVNQLGSSQSSEKPSPSSSAKAKRYVPHITIEIPTRQDINLISPGCVSLPSRRSRCTSPDDAHCSSRTMLKSPGIRVSFKRMLNQSSKEKRVMTSSNQEGSLELSQKDT